MNQQSQNNDSPVSQHHEPDLVVLVKKLQEHLFILERKIDSLINKPQENRRPLEEKRFSKPFRPHNSHYGKGEYKKHSHSNSHSYSKDEKFSSKPGFKRDRDHGSDDNRGYGEKKKPFFFKKKYQK